MGDEPVCPSRADRGGPCVAAALTQPCPEPPVGLCVPSSRAARGSRWTVPVSGVVGLTLHPPPWHRDGASGRSRSAKGSRASPLLLIWLRARRCFAWGRAFRGARPGPEVGLRASGCPCRWGAPAGSEAPPVLGGPAVSSSAHSFSVGPACGLGSKDKSPLNQCHGLALPSSPLGVTFWGLIRGRPVV